MTDDLINDTILPLKLIELPHITGPGEADYVSLTPPPLGTDFQTRGRVLKVGSRGSRLLAPTLYKHLILKNNSFMKHPFLLTVQEIQ